VHETKDREARRASRDLQGAGPQPLVLTARVRSERKEKKRV
jgi:hypothetical protein